MPRMPPPSRARMRFGPLAGSRWSCFERPTRILPARLLKVRVARSHLAMPQLPPVNDAPSSPSTSRAHVARIARRVDVWPEISMRPQRLTISLRSYQESDAERAARTGDVLVLERRVVGGVVRYCVPGLEPETAETLVAAGLIEDKPCESGERIENLAEIRHHHGMRDQFWVVIARGGR